MAALRRSCHGAKAIIAFGSIFIILSPIVNSLIFRLFPVAIFLIKSQFYVLKSLFFKVLCSMWIEKDLREFLLQGLILCVVLRITIFTSKKIKVSAQ